LTKKSSTYNNILGTSSGKYKYISLVVSNNSSEKIPENYITAFIEYLKILNFCNCSLFQEIILLVLFF